MCTVHHPDTNNFLGRDNPQQPHQKSERILKS
jgi:hypothetical protein